MVFRNEQVLKGDFIPEALPGRENEINEIAFAIQPAFEGRKAKNLFLHGPPGVGKTSCIKLVFGKMQEESQKAKAIFINCWQNPTRTAVLARIAEAIGEPMPRRGLGGDEMLERIAQNFTGQKTFAIIALDECDRLLHNGDDAVIYDLLRSSFVSAVACITNDGEFLMKTDQRIRSSLQPTTLEFKRYSPIELKKILAQRASQAFAPGVCSEEAIAVVAAYASKLGGDARVAIEALWQCGKNAEERGGGRIEKKDFEKLKENPSMAKKLQGAVEHEEEIIAFLKAKKGVATSREVYDHLNLGERAARNYLRLLEDKRIISIETRITKEGKTSKVKLLV